MRHRFIAGVIAAACLPIPAHASWFFFWIPGSVTSAIGDALTGAKGAHCVGDQAKAGDRIGIGSNTYIVKSVSGTSSRCTQPQFPIRAELELAPAQVAATQPPPSSPPQVKTEDTLHPLAIDEACVTKTTLVGESFTGAPGEGRVVSLRPENGICAPRSLFPVLAKIKYGPSSVADTPAAPPERPPLPSERVDSGQTSAQSPVALKLRELNGLLRDGLITQEDYDGKKQELLKSF